MRSSFFKRSGFFILLFTLGWQAGAAEPLSYVTSSGRWHDVQRATILDPTEKELGVPIKVVPTADRYPVLKTQVASGNIYWDLLEMPSLYCIRGATENMWEPLDYSRIPNARDMPASMRKEHFVGFINYSNVLIYNTEKYADKQPQNWADFWNVKDFPGRRSLRNTPRPTLEMALLADGVPADKLYPLDVDRAYAKLEEIKPHITVWWTSGGQAIQLMADDEIDMMGGWNGSASGAIADAGASMAYTFDQGIIEYTCLGIPRGAKRADEAMQVINAYLEPKKLAAMARMTDYGPVNRNAYNFIPDDRAKVLPSSPANLAKQAEMSAEWWASPEGVAAEERWLRFLQK